jgi:hypothetical protein
VKLASKRYDEVGGVLRNLGTDDAVKDAIEEQSKNKTITFTPGFRPDERGTEQNSHKLIRPIPKATRLGILSYDFVSSHARRLWCSVQANNSVTILFDRLSELKNDDETRRCVVGALFEDWFFNLLMSKSPLLSYARVTKGGGEKIRPWKPFQKVPRVVRFSGADASEVRSEKTSTLYLPYNNDFPFVDGFIVDGSNIWLVQVTVGKSHHPTMDQVTKIFNSIDGKFTKKGLIWVVDDLSTLTSWQSIEGTATLPEYDQLEQYICRVSQNMVYVREQGKSNDGAVCIPGSFETDKKLCSEIKNRVSTSAISVTNFDTAGVGISSLPYIYSTKETKAKKK